VRDRRDSATNSNRGNGSLQGSGALMAEFSADEAKRAFGKRSDHVAGAGTGVVHEAVDHKPAVWTDIESRFVEEENLDGPRFGRLNLFIVHNPRPNSQDGGLSTWRRASRLWIDGCG
jgi:hypothetical protein